MDKEKIKENVKKLKQGDTKRYRDSIKELVNKYPSYYKNKNYAEKFK